MKPGVPTSFGWWSLALGWRVYGFFGRLVAGLYYRWPHQVQRSSIDAEFRVQTDLRALPEASGFRLPPPDPALRNPLGKDGNLPPNPRSR